MNFGTANSYSPIIKMGNVRSLIDKPMPQTRIPKYPKFKLLYAKGGEVTYDIDPSVSFADGNPVIPFEREAEPGEILRDKNMRYRADITENLIYRGEVRARCADNEREQALQMAYCESDILYFINVFGWTFRPGGEAIPFILYDFQEDILTWFLWLVKYELSGAVEKSREMGLSWLVMAMLGYMIVFCPKHVGYMFSMTENEVDNFTEDSLFGKLRMFLERLPPFMQGGWSYRGKDETGEIIDKKMEIKIPRTGSRVEGKLTGGQGGRSGRANVNVYDEFAFVENDREVLTASASLAPTKIYISTVCGMANEFARITHSPGCLKKSPHWTEHPLKNEKWAIYERAKPEYTEEIWNQEHDINYHGSTSGRVYPRFVTRLLTGQRVEDSWVHIQDDDYYKYDEHFDVVVGMDFGISDPNFIAYAQIKQTPALFAHRNPFKNILIFFDEDEHRDQTDDELAVMLKGKGYRYQTMVGDMRSGNRRNSDGTTLIRNLSRHDLKIVGKYNSEDAPIKHVRRRLSYPGAFAIYKHGCPKLIEAFQNWSFPVDKHTGMPKAGAKPQHDKYSHPMKGVAYLIDYLDAGVVTQKMTKGRRINWDFDPIRKFNI